MCELFGVSSKYKRDFTPELKDFFSRADTNPHGWGIAWLDGAANKTADCASMTATDSIANKTAEFRMEKAAESALESSRLKALMDQGIKSDLLVAHIRYATKGSVSEKNTHPFTGVDDAGNEWVFAHNGTILECNELSKYIHIQKGETDSERIFDRLIDLMNEKHKRTDTEESPEGYSTPESQIHIIDELIRRITEGNKVNVLISDGKRLFAHSNMRETMYYRIDGDTALINSRPYEGTIHEAEWLEKHRQEEGWLEMPLNTLLVFEDGKLIYRGKPHDNEFIWDEEKMKMLFLDYSNM